MTKKDIGGRNRAAKKAASREAATAKQIDNAYLTAFANRIKAAGLALRSSSGGTQLATLPKVLEYLGSRGANTYELVALGYLRAATRIKELEDRYLITPILEDVIGPDGLLHKRVARYIMIGKRKDLPPAQGQLDLGAA
jgi:hypothetical protein